MITIKPFRAWRPEPRKVEEVTCVPYDVISTDEAREMAKNKPDSFLHVIRPEIDFEEGVDEHKDEVYAKGAENLKKLLSRPFFDQDHDPAVYVYKLTWQGRSQSGLFTCVSVEDYDKDLILKHELTRPDKEDDRTRHILEQQAHAEPVMLTCEGSDSIESAINFIQTKRLHLFEYTSPDGVTHTLWKVADYERLQEAFQAVGKLYVADGHHRCKAASRVVEEMKKTNPDHTGNEEYNFFPAVIFPKDQMRILPYNRVIHKVEENVFEKMKQELNLKATAEKSPANKGDVCAYYKGRWYSFTLPEVTGGNAADVIDAARLQQFVLSAYFGIENPRTDSNISFIGGIRGTAELEKLVDSGKADLAFSVYPTSVKELMDVSDNGLLMPPKSTWFEPKLRSGFVIHTYHQQEF
ncbi:MAG: DUF1015 family protein [Balneolales bacterium]|nr:DUF1015 family protein [Balneolales bacterium]